MSSWRPARCITALRDEVDALAPGRDKSSDGILGDAKHAARKSDHNPDANGVVKAIDITHDPASGVDTYALAEMLRQSRDDRIAYVVSNGRIFSSGPKLSPWQWREYRGDNPHSHHVHISVVADPARYDDARPWGISLSIPTGEAGERRPRLRSGDRGEAVEALQRLLGVEVDGVFGPATEAAVEAVQAARGLVVDGIVGAYTWDVLADPAPNAPRMRGITATVFGGAADPNESAYERRQITDTELGVALPYRFPGVRPKVRVTYQGRSVVCEIVDVGPWNTDDPYWLKEARPQAESGTDTRGRKTNKAGIDLTPGAARAIGLPGKGLVDWEFVGASTAPVPQPTPTPAPVPSPSQPPATPVPADDPAMAALLAAIRPVLAEHLAAAEARGRAAGRAEAEAAEAKTPAVPASIGKALGKVPVAGLSISAGTAAAIAQSLGAIDWQTLVPILYAVGGVLGIRMLPALGAGAKLLTAVAPLARALAEQAPQIQAAIEAQATAAAERDRPQARPENLG